MWRMRDDKSGHVPRTSEQARGDCHRDWYGRVRRRHPAAPDPELAQHGLVRTAADDHGCDAAQHDMGRAFHAAVWAITLVGIYLLLADARRGVPLPSPGAFTGQLLLGWGLFNLVEGIID